MKLFDFLLRKTFQLIGLFLIISSLLGMFRFALPNIGLCGQTGYGATKVTNCFNLVIFRGDDWLSIYRVRFFNGKRE